jgi:hypothetical protein
MSDWHLAMRQPMRRPPLQRHAAYLEQTRSLCMRVYLVCTYVALAPHFFCLLLKLHVLQRICDAPANFAFQ